MTQSLPADTKVWITGTNDAGYLPNPDDVRVFATQEAARLDVADRIDELADTMRETEIEPEDPAEPLDDLDSFAATAQAENIRHNADQDYSDQFSVRVDNTTHSPPVFWAQPAVIGDIFPDRSSEEYLDLVDELEAAKARQDLFHPRVEPPTATARPTINPQSAPAVRAPVVTQ